MSKMIHKIDGKILTLERTFAAPRQKVWDAFTMPELFVKWWGPRGWSTEVKEFNFTEGGVNHYGMKCEDKAQGEWYEKYSWSKMVFSNIKPIDSFEYKDYFCDEYAVVQEGMAVATCVQEFIEIENGTKIVCTGTYESEEAIKQVVEMGMLPGIEQTWDRLEELVSQ